MSAFADALEAEDHFGLFDHPACPACPGHGEFLGSLGRLVWYRCRACGIDFSTPAAAVDPFAGILQ